MAASDPTLTQIVARFDRLDVDKARGGYTLRDPHSGEPVARLRRFADSDSFELFYWSLMKDRWTTFGPLGSMRLTLDEAFEIVTTDPMFRS